MKYKMDQLLQQALSPEEEPDYWLNQKILQTAKETGKMTRKVKRIPAGIVAAALALMIGSIGVFAGWKYLAPDTVAETVFKDELLAKAFQTEDALLVNETQEYAGYKITLLGIVSGKGLSEYTEWDEAGNIEDDKTYVVTAIENADGTPRSDVSDEDYGEDSFYVSPYIKGMSMMDYNAHTLGGGYSEDVIDGIQYRMLECDNVEIFAHKGLYIGVNDGFSPNAGAFLMDETTGEITRNESYEGINALFDLPIPAFKGDEAAVNAYVEAMNAPSEEPETEEAVEPATDVQTVSKAIERWTLEDFEANAKCIIKEELIPDAQGYISYKYDLDDGGGSEATKLVTWLFEDEAIGLSPNMTIFNDDPTYIETFERHEDGSITLRVYEYYAE